MNKRIKLFASPLTFVLLTAVSFGIATRAEDNPSTIAVRGVVHFKGTPPPPKKIQTTADPQCMANRKGPLFSDEVVVGENGGLANVFVYVKSGLEGKTYPVSADKVSLQQKGCTYSPHVIGVQVNQKIEIVNSDPTMHNINARPKTNKGFNFAQPVQGMKSIKTFSEPEIMIPLKCDIHPWMHSFVNVVTHPFFSVSDAKGQFEINSLPPGTYQIEAVHESLGSLAQSVTVKPGVTATLTFTFPKP